MADAPRLEGVSDAEVARRLGLPRAVLLHRVGSTMDTGHRLARDGAPGGTLIVADEQTDGRGRSGRRWASHAGHGLWLTLVERPHDARAVEVLSLRIGIRAAGALERYTSGPVQLKWPNDLYVEGKKLAGVLVEARWREERPEWVAIGFGVNLVAPGAIPSAAALRPGVSRLDVLDTLVPALRGAAAESGPLSGREVAQFEARDLAAGRRCRSPVAGWVRGITTLGELLVALPEREATFRAGSLVLEEEP